MFHFPVKCKIFIQLTIEFIFKLFSLLFLSFQIAAEDKDECGLRLVCELAQKDPRELAQDEIQILLPYR